MPATTRRMPSTSTRFVFSRKMKTDAMKVKTNSDLAEGPHVGGVLHHEGGEPTDRSQYPDDTDSQGPAPLDAHIGQGPALANG